MNKIELSVVVPCFNEEKNILELVNRCLTLFKKKEMLAEVILVNDGSQDNTRERIDSLSSEYVKGIHIDTNKGIEQAWKMGIAKARGVYVCLIDADLQYQPEDIWRIFRELKHQHCDIVQGYRSAIGRVKDSRKFLSVCLNFILNILFSMKAKDNKSGFIVCRKEILEDILLHRFNYHYFQALIMVSARAKGYSVVEVETLFESRLLGKSFIQKFPLLMIFKTFKDLIKAIIEYRILDNQISLIIDDFLKQNPLSKSYVKTIRGFRSIYFSFYTMLLPFHHWMISHSAKTYYYQLDKSQWLSPDAIKQLQEKKLKNLISHSYYHVAYYRNLMDKKGIRPEDIHSINDLQKLPFLSKQDIKNHLYFDLLSNNHNKNKIQRIATSGSTSEPLVCYVDKTQLEMRWAATLRGLQMTGYKFGQRVARLWHQTIGMTKKQIIKERLDALICRRYFIPVFDLNEKTIKKMINKLRSIKPKLIDGYAESFNLIAQYLKQNSQNKLSVNTVNAVVSSAQMLPSDSKKIIEEHLKTNVYDKYGSREFSGIAYQCEAHDGYHVVAENYILEILKDGKPALPGETGEVVITDLNNYCMPFIRYRIGDLATASNGAPCSCGRGLPKIQHIQGRVQSIIIGANGNYIPGALFGHLFKDYYFCVKQYQVIQTQLSNITLIIVKASRFDNDIFNKILDELKHYLGKEMKIEVKFQEKIELTRTGKHQAVLSKIPIDFQHIKKSLGL